MNITFQKKEDQSIITITRTDGSITYAVTNHAGVIHNLCHYAIERAMKFKRAYYGLINEGYEIEDFDKPRNTQPIALLPKNLPLEAKQVEHMAGLFQLNIIDPGVFLYFKENLKMALDINEIPFPENFDDALILTIAETLEHRINQWKALPVNESLELTLKL